MSDIELFKQLGSALTELATSSSPLEKALQTLLEQNLETLLDVRFLASEFMTSNGGRMDTLGIDENGYPVIIKYKRERSENVINQGHMLGRHQVHAHFSIVMHLAWCGLVKVSKTR